MKCPACNFKIPQERAWKPGVCDNCGALFQFPTQKVGLLLAVFGGLLWLAVDAVFFQFRSAVSTALAFLISNLLVLFVVLQVIRLDSRDPER